MHEAENYQRGLIEAGTRRPDLVVLDLGLPDGDGVDLIRDLRQWSAAPVIVLSTFAGGLMAGWFSGNALRIVFGVMAFFIAANIILPFQQQLGDQPGPAGRGQPVARLATGAGGLKRIVSRFPGRPSPT